MDESRRCVGIHQKPWVDAEEALTLAVQTQDDWELVQRIATQWHALAVHKKGKEEKRQ